MYFSVCLVYMPFVNKSYRQSGKQTDRPLTFSLSHNIPHNGRGLKDCTQPEGGGAIRDSLS